LKSTETVLLLVHPQSSALISAISAR